VVGSGPAGLMAASVARAHGASVTVLERRPGLGRKLLIAGSSGLNISHDAPIEEFLDYYRARSLSRGAACDDRLLGAVLEFPSEAWVQFVRSLGHECFVGTSGRWFVREMKASQLLQSWTGKLRSQGVEFLPSHPIETPEALEELRAHHDSVVLALGGASWEDSPPRWPAMLEALGVSVSSFTPSNVGHEVDFPTELLREAEGKPIKNCTLTTRLGSRQGELVITRYGLEGTPMYFVGTPGDATLALKPELSLDDWMALLRRPMRENLSPMRKLKKIGGLSEAALALIYHLTPASIRDQLTTLGLRVHAFPIRLGKPRPLEEAISSTGGVRWDELDQRLMLRKLPGVFCAGEMIDWDAPTGGFLIQASVALGARAGRHASA
jgi:uncharacterized flavoprotein (TIGR03862 family)